MKVIVRQKKIEELSKHLSKCETERKKINMVRNWCIDLIFGKYAIYIAFTHATHTGYRYSKLLSARTCGKFRLLGMGATIRTRLILCTCALAIYFSWHFLFKIEPWYYVVCAEVEPSSPQSKYEKNKPWCLYGETHRDRHLAILHHSHTYSICVCV